MNSNTFTASQDRFGQQVAARLAAGTAELPYDVTERLRAARAQALVKRRRVAGLHTAAVVSASGGAAVLAGDDKFSWWRGIASAVPIVALAAGLILVYGIQNERRANEVAEVDTALLTDDLPPAAYADSGFIQFLKQSSAAKE